MKSKVGPRFTQLIRFNATATKPNLPNPIHQIFPQGLNQIYQTKSIKANLQPQFYESKCGEIKPTEN